MNYVKLSEGEYSGYSPDYYGGKVAITQEELDEQGKIVGDKIIAEYEAYPEREYKPQYSWQHQTTEKYDPITNKSVYTYDHGEKWKLEMEKWLTEKGYTKLPNDLPEINIHYSDIPHH